MCTSHTVKDVSILCEGRLHLVYKEVDIGTKSISENFSDNLEAALRRLMGQNLFTKELPSFFLDKGNQGIIKAPKIHVAIVKLIK